MWNGRRLNRGVVTMWMRFIATLGAPAPACAVCLASKRQVPLVSQHLAVERPPFDDGLVTVASSPNPNAIGQG